MVDWSQLVIDPDRQWKLGCYDFPGGLDDKASVYNAGDLGSIPGLGSSLEKEKATHSGTLA